LRRLAEVRGKPGVGRTRVARGDRRRSDERVCEDARPALRREVELVRETRIGRAYDAVCRAAPAVRRMLGFEYDAHAVIPCEPLEQEERGTLGQAGDRG